MRRPISPPRFALPALGLALFAGSLFAADTVNRTETDWWLTPRRMIQTNLREIDASMDLDEYVAALEAARANVVLFNVGGIVANYPTALPYQYRNPFMTGDLTGVVVDRLHAEGIRVIARFDFSKVNEQIAAKHPEWLTRDGEGRSIPPYNGQVATCLNGWYQQVGMFEIIGEVLERYPIDGVFFNMIGYPRSDYSDRPIGVCQCDGCRTRFREWYALELPADDRADTETVRKYAEFKRRTISEQFQKVNRLVKGRNPNVAICTYTAAGVDLIRKESNSPLDTWMYEESYRTRMTLLEHPGKQQANAAVHFPHYDYVHQGGRLLLTGGPVPPELKCLGLRANGPTLPQQKGTYLRIRPEDKARLDAPVFDHLDLLRLNGEVWTGQMENDIEDLLRFIPPAMFGPPEKCYYTEVSDTPALYARTAGQGRVAWIPWRVGTHFEELGHAGHAALVTSALDRLLELPRRLRVEAPAVVEVTHRADRAGRFEWLSLYNHSGQLDRVLGSPLPIRDLSVHIQPRLPVKSARLLKAGQPLPLTATAEGAVEGVVRVLNAYEIVLLEY